MHWGDLALLNRIDRLEQSESGYLIHGLGLMQHAADGAQLDPSRDYALFVRELLLAREAGLVSWGEPALSNVDPLSNASYWLQQIRDVRLTLAGRDRARGRVILRQLPDPHEDDDRLITGKTLEEVARAIAEELTESQLARFLVDSGIPEDFLMPTPGVAKWQYVKDVLERVLDGGSAARRVLREFIGQWLEDRLDCGPRPEVRRRVLALLARSGWFVNDGRLVIGERRVGDLPDAAPTGRAARVAALNPAIRQVADPYLDSGHAEVAVFEAFKAVTARVKSLTGIASDGTDLMNRAFGGDSPQLVLADLSTAIGKDIQDGFRFMFMGAVRAIRNPNAHEQFKPLDDSEALELVTFASLLMRRLDQADGAAGR